MPSQNSSPDRLTPEELRHTGAVVLVDSAPIAEHPDHPGWDAEATEEEILRGMRQELANFESGDVAVSEPPRDPSTPEWQDYCRRAQEHREALIRGENPGPRPEPPPTASIREHPSFRQHLEQEAAKLRAEIRPLAARVALDRHRDRGRDTATLQTTRRRTHGTRRRASVRPVRRSSTRAGPSDSEPHEPGGDDPPPRDSQLLLGDLAAYLERLGPWGAERDWLIEQVAYLGHAPERVSAAVALLVSEGRARRDDDVIRGRS